MIFAMLASFGEVIVRYLGPESQEPEGEAVSAKPSPHNMPHA